MYRPVILFLFLVCGNATAHQWTPTYFKLEPSHVAGIYKTRMKLFNSRTDVEYYQIQVFDGRWDPIKFAITGASHLHGSGSSDIINVPHKSTKYIEIYVPSYDRTRAVYICSRSMLLRENETASVISSRICSKVE
jgi:hypothetical protein